MEYGFLTLLPPIIAIIAAVALRKVAVALLIGIFTGELILFGWNPFTAIDASLNEILTVCTDTGNLKTFLFTALMGAFVIMVEVSGGVDGFVAYLTEQSQKVKSKRAAMLIAYVIGIIIFIDGLLSIMFTGVVTRPLIDKYKVSREKLAYICDATSAPVNAIIPLNSWGAMLMGLIAAEISAGFITGDPMTLLIQSLPFQFYSILSLIFVLFYILTGKDWGPMKRAELRVQNTGALYDEGVTPLLNDQDGIERLVPAGKGNKWNMILPLIVLIGGTFIGLFVTGGGSIIDGSGTTAILYSVIITLIFMGIIYTRQKIMTSKQFSDYLLKGVSNMINLVCLLVLAFAIGAVVKKLETGIFMASLIGDQVSGALCPAIIFVLGAVMAFATGTSWGTFSIMMPIAIPMAVAMDANILLTIGAVISGGIFGDHCSPISDTTILSSMSVGTDLFSHVKTQLPYALVTAALATVLYVVCGFAL
ncbi:Na+/H+ antiporter NhaC family protein [Angelakisella massiliensis]|uniref:Na+/H+ antiporter NhaC family protein n=1 Tax=Angelakisella massiliensis TaxID=1871018 RepID=UPI0008F93BFE|nr:Na+/H+ antiporter NhaC family protein [Angelakisella massiliensis]